MERNRIAVFTGPGRVELREEPIAEPGRGEALVRIEACALCTMEQRLWKGTQHDYPIAAGHETAGVVAAVHPEGVIGLRAGQRVAVAFLDRCMQCDACRRGDTQLCTGKMKGREPGVLRRIGGLADYALVPAWKLFAMPDDRSFDEIALCEPLACVIHSINKGGLRLGDEVLVVGCGVMGLLHVLLARLRGARVVVSDPDPGRRRLALDLGARAAFEPARVKDALPRVVGDEGVDAVFVTIGNQDAASQASAAVRPGGRLVYYGAFPEGVVPGADPRRIHQQELLLDGARGQTLDDWRQAARLLAADLVDLTPLVSARHPLQNLAQALAQAILPSSLRVLVHP